MGLTQSTHQRLHNPGDDRRASSGASLFWYRLTNFFTRTCRKRKRDDEDTGEEGSSNDPQQQQGRNKVIRLDAATSTHLLSTTSHASSQTSSSTDSCRNTSSQTTPSSPSKPIAESHPQWLDFGFLQDTRTVQHCHASRVMFMMRGLPGSGKSTVVKAIRRHFPANSVSCSADDFFIVDGVYQFNAKQLKDAHAACHAQCEAYCVLGTPVIVVDNTNIVHWEMSKYFSLAASYRYCVVVVEPRTPWKMDVDELVARNSHGVPRQVIQRRIRDMQQTIKPKYFGWFLNLADSRLLMAAASQILVRCLLECDRFLQDFSQFTNQTQFSSLLTYFNRDTCRGASHDILHMTAKFFRKGEDDNYMRQPQVEKNLGRSELLHITGFSVSRRAFGAKLQLTPEQQAVWAQNDMELRRPVKNGGGYSGLPMKDESSDMNHDYEDYSMASLRLSHETASITEASNTKGRRAHITIGTAPDTPPVETGFDVIEGMQLLATGGHTFSASLAGGSGVPGVTLYQLRQDLWFIHLNQKITVNGMFTGNY